MATVKRSVATLRISGDALVPAAITRALGAEPSAAQIKGESLVSKSTGNVRIAKFGMWRLEATLLEPAVVDSHVIEILEKITPDLSFWKPLTGEFSADLFCGLFMQQTNEGLELWAQTLAALGNRGIKLGFDDVVAYVRDFGSKIPNARPSMLLDHMANRRSEIDAINGAIPPAAKSVGLAAPYNEVISGLVRAKERRLGCA